MVCNAIQKRTFVKLVNGFYNNDRDRLKTCFTMELDKIKIISRVFCNSYCNEQSSVDSCVSQRVMAKLET